MLYAFLGCSSDSGSDSCVPISCQNGGTSNADCGCNCPQGYGGTDCSTQLTPSKIKITKIRILKFLNSGAGLDDGGTNPDILISVDKGSANLYTSTVYYSNSDGLASIPYDFTPPTPIESIQTSTIFTLNFWDYDDNSSYEFLNSIYFSPFVNISGFPSSITIQDTNGNYKAQLYLTYEW